MSGKRWWRCLFVLMCVLTAAPVAYAMDWMDPLNTRPIELDLGKVLPGDSQVHLCHGKVHEPAHPLTLVDAIDLALCHNPQVQSAWAAIKVQAAQVGEARAAYLPNITAGFSHLDQKTERPDSESQDSTERTIDARYVTLTWRLLDFGGRDANRQSANALLKAALASHDAILQRTIGHVVGLYFEAHTAKANLETKEKNELLARETLGIAKKREARSNGAQSDTLQAKTSLAKAELEHTRAQGVYEKSSVSLGVVVGFPMKTVLRQNLILAPDYQEDGGMLREDLATWLTFAQEQHPAVVAVRAQLDSAKERLKATRSEGLPTLDFTQSEYVNGRPNQGVPSTQTRESVSGFTVNVPLFEGFGRTYKVRGAQAQIDVKEAELLDVQLQVVGEVAKAHADAVAALRNLESSQRLLLAAHDAMGNVQRKYDQGVSDILEMLSVQVTMADAGQERIRALAEWRSARLRLLANTGMAGIHRLTE